MNYQKVYNELCLKYKALNFKKIKGLPGAFESHHIVPVACGGPNTSDNLVVFPLKAHFIAHHLLKKIYKGTQHEIAMDNAFNLMCNTKTDYHTGKQYGVRTTMRVYINAKLDAAKHKIGDANPAKRLDVRKKLSAKAKGRTSWNKGLKMKPLSTKHKEHLSQKFSGRIWINDGIKDYFVLSTDDRVATFNRGRLKCHTEESRQKLSLANKGKPNLKNRARKGKPNFKNRGKHQSKETIEKIRKHMEKLIWVTNGNICMRVLPNEIPEGFIKGRIIPKQKIRRHYCIKQFSLDSILIAKFKSLREIERVLGIRHEYLSRLFSVNKHEYKGYNWYVYEWYE